MTKTINKQNTLMIAHRGLSGLEKENTIMAFTAACQLSYYGCECDIHKTKDGKYVVIHDSDTLRVAGKSLIIEESNFKDIRKLELLGMDNKPHKILQIPTLEEYINTLKRYNKKAIIEYKNTFQKEDVKEVLDLIKSLGYLDHCIFISFGIENLIHTLEYQMTLPCQYLMVEPTEEKLSYCFKYHMGIDLYYRFITKELVERFHNANLFVNCWTVNEVEEGNLLASLGVDFITTNILE